MHRPRGYPEKTFPDHLCTFLAPPGTPKSTAILPKIFCSSTKSQSPPTRIFKVNFQPNETEICKNTPMQMFGATKQKHLDIINLNKYRCFFTRQFKNYSKNKRNWIVPRIQNGMRIGGSQGKILSLWHQWDTTTLTVASLTWSGGTSVGVIATL